MKCHNYKCKEDCDSLKLKYCILKVNREQFELKKQWGCRNCGARETRAIYKDEKALLCTNCGIIRKGEIVLGYCIANGKTAQKGAMK